MSRLRTHAVGGAVALSTALVVAPVARAQKTSDLIFGPTRSYVVNGCASGSVGYDPVTSREIQGTIVCAQGSGLLGYTQLSGLTLLTLQLNLTLTPGAPYPSNGVITETGGLFRVQYTGAGCTSGGLCSGLYQGMSAVSNGGGLQFFPPVPSVGSVDLASVDFTQAQIFFDYTLPTVPGFAFSSTRADLQLSAVPEPSTLVLTVGGLAAFAAVVRRRPRIMT